MTADNSLSPDDFEQVWLITCGRCSYDGHAYLVPVTDAIRYLALAGWMADTSVENGWHIENGKVLFGSYVRRRVLCPQCAPKAEVIA